MDVGSVTTLLVGCGAFTGQDSVALGPAAGRAQAAIVEHAELAEVEGLDSFWLGEHHFADDGYTSAVFPLLGAVAARTDRLILGTRVILAPLHNALLLAEDAAQVALLCGGRFLLGLGLGYRDEELRSLRVPRAERVARLIECVEVARKAWTGQPFDHHGPSVDATHVLCRPAPPHPPEIWTGGRAPRALARAARLADGYVAPLGGAEETLALIAAIDGLVPDDRSPLPVSTSRMVAITTGAPGDAAITRGLAEVVATYRRWKGADAGINAATVSQLDRGVASGTPDQVAAALAPAVTALAGRRHHLVVRLEYPGMTPAQVADHVRIFAREVAPRLRMLVQSAPARASEVRAG